MAENLNRRTLFEDRIVAYLDILGFKDIVKNQILSDQEILNLLYFIRNNNSTFLSDVKRDTRGDGNSHIVSMRPDIYSFSDSIVISLPLKQLFEGVDRHADFLFFHTKTILQYISAFYKHLLPYGIALRGAISVGKIHYNIQEPVIVGKPLIEAIEAEHEKAVNPRVILTESFLSHFNFGKPNQRSLLDIFFKVAQDGLYYARLFPWSDFYMNDGNGNMVEIQGVKERLDIITTKIKEKMKEYETKSGIFSKWEWLLNSVEEERKEAQDYFCQHFSKVKVNTDG